MNTHIVNVAMMLKSEAVSHQLLGEDYTDNAEKLREILDRYNGTAFEGFTGDEVLSDSDPTRGTELCLYGCARLRMTEMPVLNK